MSDDRYLLSPPPRFGNFAILASLAAIGSMFASCSGHALLGLLLAILSLPLGLFGILRATAPEIRGGFISLASVALGVLGLIVAVCALIWKIVIFPLR